MQRQGPALARGSLQRATSPRSASSRCWNSRRSTAGSSSCCRAWRQVRSRVGSCPPLVIQCALSAVGCAGLGPPGAQHPRLLLMLACWPLPLLQCCASWRCRPPPHTATSKSDCRQAPHTLLYFCYPCTLPGPVCLPACSCPPTPRCTDPVPAWLPRPACPLCCAVLCCAAGHGPAEGVGAVGHPLLCGAGPGALRWVMGSGASVTGPCGCRWDSQVPSCCLLLLWASSSPVGTAPRCPVCAARPPPAPPRLQAPL